MQPCICMDMHKLVKENETLRTSIYSQALKMVETSKNQNSTNEISFKTFW